MKKLLFAFLYITGLTRFIAWCNRNRVTILCYHSVTEQPYDISDDPYKQHLHCDLFAAHLDHLQRRYRVISLRDYIAARDGKALLPRHSVILTFDDGFRNLLTVAAPLLSERSLPATTFIITGPTSAREDLNPTRTWTQSDDDTNLSWIEVQELAREHGIEIGSHTCSHPCLTTVSYEEAKRELRDSYTEIITRLECEVPPFAYPYGEASESLKDLVSSVGYACALTGELGANELDSNPYHLKRIVIAADDDLATFAARVAGLTWYFNELRINFRNVTNELSSTARFRMDWILRKCGIPFSTLILCLLQFSADELKWLA